MITVSRRLIGLLVCMLTLSVSEVMAATIDADPSDYREKLQTLLPGDTLRLGPGIYRRLSLADLNGTSEAWITITAATAGTAVIEGESCCNTVQIRRCSYVAIRNLVIDSLGIPNIDGINVKDGRSHHLLIENNLIRGVGANQGTVGISTKSPVWNAVIRANSITEPGTGMYLGNSNGAAPFIAGVIEGNFVENPIGYAIQIKHQNPYEIDALPDTPNVTLIRHNTLAKDDRQSPGGDRPNLLVGTFPDSGQGSQDRYEIYGNFLFYNPRESLLQATGTVAIHDNVLVGAGNSQSAIRLTDHNGPLREAHVYNNTIYGGGRGVYFADQARSDHSVVANAVFAQDPIGGAVVTTVDNITGPASAAGDYFIAPSAQPGDMDFTPQTGQLVDGPVSFPTAYAAHTDFDRDFNGQAKQDRRFRGAYAGFGPNAGWPLDLNRKPLGSGSPKAPVIISAP